jgi:signal transduction histidine kinase
MGDPTRFKLQAAVGFAGIVVLSSGALLGAISTERATSRRSTEIMAEYRQAVGAARQLELEAERLVAAVRGYLLSDAEPGFLDSLEGVRATFDRHVSTLERSLRGPGSEYLLWRIRAATGGYRAALDSLTAGRSSELDRDALARVFEDILVPRRKALTRAIGDFVDQRESNLDASQAAVRARAGRSERRVLTFALLAPIAASVLAWIVSRRLGQLYDAREEATRRAEQAAQRRDDMLGIVAHDLRSPLNVICLRAGLLREAATDPAARGSIESILRTVSRMDALIAGLLDTAAIESGQFRVVKDDCPASEIVSSLTDVFTPLAGEKGVELSARIEPADLVVAADRDRLIQLLANLLSNAVKFSGRGDRVELRATSAGGGVIFEVSDSGPGIPAELRPRIFDRYWKGRGPGGGVGLGLYIAKAIAEAHGGDIGVESEEGAGTSFRVRLPAAAPRDRAA